MLTHIKYVKYVATILAVISIFGMVLGWQGNELKEARKSEADTKAKLAKAEQTVKIVERVKEVEKRVYIKAKDGEAKIIEVQVPAECDGVVAPWRSGIDGMRLTTIDIDDTAKP